MSVPSHIHRILCPRAVLGFMGTDLSRCALFVHRGGDEGRGAIDAHSLQVPCGALLRGGRCAQCKRQTTPIRFDMTSYQRGLLVGTKPHRPSRINVIPVQYITRVWQPVVTSCTKDNATTLCLLAFGRQTYRCCAYAFRFALYQTHFGRRLHVFRNAILGTVYS